MAKLYVGGREVVASGSLVIPGDADEALIAIEDLNFKFLFEPEDNCSKPFESTATEKALELRIAVPETSSTRGFIRRFTDVASLNGSDLSMAFILKFYKNGGKTLNYTFVTSPKVVTGSKKDVELDYE